jgi:hypothetical protein
MILMRAGRASELLRGRGVQYICSKAIKGKRRESDGFRGKDERRTVLGPAASLIGIDKREKQGIRATQHSLAVA